MKFLLFIVFIYAVYHFYVDSSGAQAMTARDIDPSCDVVLFTTASCPYCKKARNLMISKGQRWCDKDINRSSENRRVYKSLGGKGVPVAVIGDQTLHGYREGPYVAALNQLK